MTAIRHSILAVASLLALGLWLGNAAAGEPEQGDPAADEVNNGDAPLSLGDLAVVSTGQSVAMGAVSDADATVDDNDIEVGDDSYFMTGDAMSMQNNSGGINVNMVNTGNNVVMQTNTTMNLYLLSN
jgi:hypothetical protein